MKFTRHVVVGLVGVALSGCATACATGSATTGSQPPRSAQPEPPETRSGQPGQGKVRPAGYVASRHLPLGEFMYTGSEISRIDAASAILVQQCMRDLGFASYVSEPVADDLSDDVAELDDLRYGSYDAEQAKETGYKPAFVAGGGNRLAAPGAETESTDEEWEALTGTTKEQSDEPVDAVRAAVLPNGKAIPRGGCLGQAKAETTGDNGIAAALVQRLNGESFKKSLKDARVTNVFAQWSSCMKGKGYQYADPMEANDDPNFAGAAASELEKETATADMACKSETHLIDTWFEAESAIQTQLVSQHRAELAEIKKAKQSALAAAADILKGR